MKLLKQNIGLGASRTKYTDPYGKINREKVFQEVWNKENRPRPGLDYGHGILQDLFVKSIYDKDFDGPDRDDDPTKLPLYHGFVYKITPREYRIVATIVQWFGSNVGFSFISECLERCGYSIKETSRLDTKAVINKMTKNLTELPCKQIETNLSELYEEKAKEFSGTNKEKPAKIINTIRKLEKRLDKIKSKRKMHYINGI